MNVVNLIGRITKDPEIKSASNGKNFVAFTLAVTEFSNGNQYTNFVPCFAWDKTAENMAKFVKKGNQLGVQGSLNVRQNNANGQYTTSISVNAQRVEFLGSNQTGSQTTTQQNYSKKENIGSSDNANPFANYGFDHNEPQSGDFDSNIEDDAILFED